MANVSNAYQALLGAGESVAASKKKKNNKTKAKKVDAEISSVPVSAPAPVSGPAHTNGPVKTSESPSAVDVSEATDILERAAREAKSIEDKCKLWKDWSRQGNDRSGKGLKYKTSDGLLLDFKQVLLRSKALEITIDSSLVSGLGHEHHEILSTLLSVFIASQGSGSASQALASQLIRLAALLIDEAPDTLGAAQRAVRSVITALKAGVEDHSGHGEAGAVSSWLSRLSIADKDISKQQGLLQKLSATSGGVVTKEQLNCAKAIYKLSEEKFDLLQPKNIPASKLAPGSADATSKALQELKSVINSHLSEATALEASAKTKGNSAEAQRVQTLAACRREEAIVVQESQEVAAQVRTLETQLRALKSRQLELDDKRAQLQQRSRAVIDSMGSSRSAGAVLNTAHYRDQMAVVEALDELVNPSQHSTPQQILSVQQSQANAPLEYINNGQQYISLAVACLAEVPSKLNFCKQRISHADKLIKLVGGDSHGKQKEEAEKLLADHMKAAEDIKRGAMQVVNELNQRYDVISSVSPEHAALAAEQLRAVDALTTQLRDAYDTVQAAFAAPLVEPPPVPASSRAPGQGRASGAAANGKAAAQPRAAVAAVDVPAVAPVAPVPVAAVPVAPAPRPPSAPARQWGRVAAVAPLDEDSSLPTPAEAFKAAAEASTSADGFKEAAPKKNRKKA